MEIRSEIRGVFIQLFDCDIDNHDDVRKIQEVNRWAQRMREGQIRWQASKVTFLWSVITALFGGAATFLAEYLIRERR